MHLILWEVIVGRYLHPAQDSLVSYSHSPGLKF
jgi:hypothetical protein